MKIEYAPRAIGDVERIGRRSRRAYGNEVAAALETYIRATVARIAVVPESGERLRERPRVRVVPLVRYPFKIFYTARKAARSTASAIILSLGTPLCGKNYYDRTENDQIRSIVRRSKRLDSEKCKRHHSQ